VFAYPGLNHNVRVVFDPTYPAVDIGIFIKTDWRAMYGDVKEMIPSDAPNPRGKEVDLRLSVYVNTSGKAGAQIPQLPLGDDSSPWGR
jgi:hypothetical protein